MTQNTAPRIIRLANFLIFVTISTIQLTACGGAAPESGTGNTLPTIINDGYFIDSTVQGLSYTAGSANGVTAEDGYMQYQVGKTFTAKLGKVTVGSTLGREIVTPVDLVSGKHTGNATVQNISRFLVYLDNDANLVNGIQINANLQQAANDWTVRFNSNFLNDIDQDVTPDVLAYNAANRALVDAATIQKHLNASIACAYSGAYEGTYEQNGGNTNNGQWIFFLKSDGTMLALTKAPDQVYRHTGTILYDATNARNLKPIYFDPQTGEPVLDDTGNPTFDLTQNIPVIRSDHASELRFIQTDSVSGTVSYETEMTYTGNFDATHRYEFDTSSTFTGIVFSGTWVRTYNINGSSPSDQVGVFSGSKIGTYVDATTYNPANYTYYRGIIETDTMLAEISIAIQKNTGNVVATSYEATVSGTGDQAQININNQSYTGTTANITTDSDGVLREGTITLNGNTLSLTSTNPADPLGSTIITGTWGTGNITACQEAIIPRP